MSELIKCLCCGHEQYAAERCEICATLLEGRSVTVADYIRERDELVDAVNWARTGYEHAAEKLKLAESNLREFQARFK